MLRDVPGTGMYFWTYSYLKDLLGLNKHDHCSGGSWRQYCSLMVAGGFAGQVSWLVAYPFDVIKTKI
jgi:solute carrier family 25 carnitine/acylcarnitine transporter 20/29